VSAPTAPLRQPASIEHAKRALLARHHVVAPSLKVADAAAASVFGAARLRGPIARDVIAQVTKLSIATVNRQVTALLDAGILRERADLAVSGAIGRPRVPVEVNHEPFLTLGIHIGARTTSIVATDLFGRTLDVVETPTPRGAQDAALASLASSARRYLSRWHRRTPLWVGVAAGGVVDGTTGYLDHQRLGWSDAPVGPVLAETLGLPVSVASHVDAMAGAELLLGVRRQPTQSSTSLYVYARETVGYALSIGGRVHSPASGPGTIAALPAHSELLGGSGQLESTVSDEAVLIAARKARIIPAEGPGSTVTAVLRSARQGNQQARAAARHAQPRRSGGRRPGVHRVPRGDESRRGRVRRAFGAAGARHPGHRVRQPSAGSGSRGGVARRALLGPDRGDAARTEPPPGSLCLIGRSAVPV
jgi:predicted NBD/HSP70 family sugar kinase